MKKLFMVLSLLIIGLVGATQTYAYSVTLTDLEEYPVEVWSSGVITITSNESGLNSFELVDMFNNLEVDQIMVMNVTTKVTTGSPQYPVSIAVVESIFTQSALGGHEFVTNVTHPGDSVVLDNTDGTITGARFDTTLNGAENGGVLELKILELPSPDLELIDLTDGASLTQVQDDIMTQMLQSTMDVTLTIDGVDHVLSYRSTSGIYDYITEVDDPDGTGGWRVYYDTGNIFIKDDTGAVPVSTFSLGMNVPPTISGSGVYLSDYDNPATVADVQATLTAADDPDGDLTSSIIVFEDNYTGNENVLGDHIIVFQVSDAAGNDTQFNVTVQVVDITPAVITLNGDAVITKGIGDAPCSYPGAYATDNVDGADIQLDAVCNVDTSVVGTYTITYDYTDTSGNVSETAVVTVNVVDTESPYVQSNVQNITTYNSQNLTINQVLSGITVVDDHDVAFDGTYTVTVDNYTGNESIEGSYTVTLSATDAAGNIMTHVITIIVIDDLPPVITGSSYLLTSAEVAAMTQAEIKAHIESRNP